MRDARVAPEEHEADRSRIAELEGRLADIEAEDIAAEEALRELA